MEINGFFSLVTRMVFTMVNSPCSKRVLTMVTGKDSKTHSNWVVSAEHAPLNRHNRTPPPLPLRRHSTFYWPSPPLAIVKFALTHRCCRNPPMKLFKFNRSTQPMYRRNFRKNTHIYWLHFKFILISELNL